MFATAVGSTTVTKSAENGAGSPNIRSAEPRNRTQLTIVTARLRIPVNICLPLAEANAEENS